MRRSDKKRLRRLTKPTLYNMKLEFIYSGSAPLSEVADLRTILLGRQTTWHDAIVQPARVAEYGIDPGIWDRFIDSLPKESAGVFLAEFKQLA